MKSRNKFKQSEFENNLAALKLKKNLKKGQNNKICF